MNVDVFLGTMDRGVKTVSVGMGKTGKQGRGMREEAGFGKNNLLGSRLGMCVTELPKQTKTATTNVSDSRSPDLLQ